MAQDVTTVNGGQMGILLPSFSPICRDGLVTPKVVQTVDEGGDVRVVPGVWELPAVVTEPMIFEYRRWLDALGKCDAPAQDGRMRVWLSKLLFGLSGNFSEEMIRGKMSAYAFALADKPAFCFDDAVLRRAQKHFKSFWPSAGELIEFMERVEAETRIKAERAWKIIDGGPRAAGAAEPGTDAAIQRHREKQDRERRELAAILAERDAAQGKHAPDAETPRRMPGETDKQFVARLTEHTRAQITLGRRALKRDNHMRTLAAKTATKAAYEATGIEVQPKPADDTASASAENTMSCDGGGA
jgi:hypothetical protein